MNGILRFAIVAAVTTATACAAPVAMAATKASPADTAVQAAAKRGRYAIVTFYKQNDAASKNMLEEAKKLKATYSSRADFVIADAGNAVHKDFLAKYTADRAPMPLTLVIAPNGAVTAGYPNAIGKTDISEAFVSNGMADVLKVLQNGNLAAVCVQSSKTIYNQNCVALAEGLRTGGQFRGALEVVKLDLADSREAQLVQTFKIDPKTEKAQLVVIAPPGRILGTFEGVTTVGAVSAFLVSKLSGGTCGAGGGGGCCPK